MPMTVVNGETVARSGDVHFRNALCEQIAKIVQNVSVQESEEIALRFADGSLIAISLRPEDYSGPEAIHAHGFRESSMSSKELSFVIA